MAIIVNTNMSALKTQKNLNNASNSLQTALERMSTGLKINKAADDAAGLYVATNLNTQISGSKVAKNNISTGNNVLSTLEGDLDVIMDNLNRIRDLSVQAANSIYDESAMGAMKDEIDQRLQEIDRISLASNFNGLQLLAGEGQLAENAISLDKTFFAKTDSSTLGSSYKGQLPNGSKLTANKGLSGNLELAFANASSAAQYIDIIDAAIDDISSKKSTIGATMNRLDAALTSLTTVIENNTAAKSTIMDADIAEESAEYTKQQILQQTSSALLVQANQLPSLALNLIQ